MERLKKKSKVVRDNKLIVDFMEGKKISRDNYYLPEHEQLAAIPYSYDCQWNSIYNEKELKYHSSWNWLMPVVEKIEGITSSVIYGSYNDGDEINRYTHVRFIISGWDVRIDKFGNYGTVVYENWMSLSRKDRTKSRIGELYRMVVKFINWYNNKQGDENEG